MSRRNKAPHVGALQGHCFGELAQHRRCAARRAGCPSFPKTGLVLSAPGIIPRAFENRPLVPEGQGILAGGASHRISVRERGAPRQGRWIPDAPAGAGEMWGIGSGGSAALHQPANFQPRLRRYKDPFLFASDITPPPAPFCLSLSVPWRGASPPPDYFLYSAPGCLHDGRAQGDLSRGLRTSY